MPLDVLAAGATALEGIPIIVVSARDPQTEQERLAQSGADVFFRKPLDYDELLMAISQALGTTRGE
jgi:DNA-binding response OmpR family regulator